MGWLRRLIRIFKPEPDLELIPLTETTDWLQAEAKLILNESKRDLAELIRKLKDRRWMLECYLDDWEEKLKREPNSEILYLLQETRKILEQITFAEIVAFERILSLSRQLEADFERMVKLIEESPWAKDYHFFISEQEKGKITLNPLLKEILELEGFRKDLEQCLIRAGLRKIEAIIYKLRQLEGTVLKSEELSILIKHKTERLNSLETSRLEKEQDHLALQKDPRYPEAEAFSRRKKEIGQQQMELSSKLKDFFSDLRPILSVPLIDNTLLENRAFLEKYFSDPLAALLADGDFKILSLFEALREALVSGQISLEADEARVVFFRLNKGSLVKEWQTNYIRLKQELRDCSLAFVHQDFLAKVEDLNYRLEHFSEKLDSSREAIYHLESKRSNLKESIIRDKRLIEDLIKIGLRKEMQIVIPG
ncbi:hypothetical protein J4479_02215 [Candidatus Woesearchaeota archaeon]|nr:hypothetical protein [Candidatus Woesearchaeota archaeon]